MSYHGHIELSHGLPVAQSRVQCCTGLQTVTLNRWFFDGNSYWWKLTTFDRIFLFFSITKLFASKQHWGLANGGLPVVTSNHLPQNGLQATFQFENSKVFTLFGVFSKDPQHSPYLNETRCEIVRFYLSNARTSRIVRLHSQTFHPESDFLSRLNYFSCLLAMQAKLY